MAQLFVRSLRDGVVTVPLEVAESITTLRGAVQGRCGVPPELQRLRCGLRELRTDADVASLRPEDTVCLLLRLVGGKGGFGSLLRVQGRDTKATTNFEACRDLSGRRLRHVNAVKKMEEWKLNVKERELEETALKYVKESIRNERRQKRKSVDPEMVSSMQRETVSNVKRAVQSALETVREGPPRTAKKRRFVHDDENSDSSSDSEDEVSLQSSSADEGDSHQQPLERESDQTSYSAKSGSHKDQTLDV